LAYEKVKTDVWVRLASWGALDNTCAPQPGYRCPLLYSILAYHEEGAITSMSPEEDAALMSELLSYHNGLIDQCKMGPAARLDFTRTAITLRGPGSGDVIDGPFAETKEALLGLYVVDCASQDEAVEIARGLRRANPTAVYEIRPVMLYLPGTPFSGPGQ
jgi:hypothetical protein